MVRPNVVIAIVIISLVILVPCIGYALVILLRRATVGFRSEEDVSSETELGFVPPRFDLERPAGAADNRAERQRGPGPRVAIIRPDRPPIRGRRR